MSADHVVELSGIGFFSPGFADAGALASLTRDETVTEPATTLGSRRHMRFTSSVTRMAIAVFEQAVDGSDIDLSKVNVLFASSQGEVQIAVELLEKVASEGGASPARFMNSVHNTAVGHLSIATRSHNNFSALAGREQTVAAALIESYAQLASGDADNIVILAADEALPAPLDLEDYDGLAMALLLRRVHTSEARGPAITGIHRDPGLEPYAIPPQLAHLAGNPCSPALGLLDAFARGHHGPVRIDDDRGRGWCAVLTPRSPA